MEHYSQHEVYIKYVADDLTLYDGTGDDSLPCGRPSTWDNRVTSSLRITLDYIIRVIVLEKVRKWKGVFLGKYKTG